MGHVVSEVDLVFDSHASLSQAHGVVGARTRFPFSLCGKEGALEGGWISCGCFPIYLLVSLKRTASYKEQQPVSQWRKDLS